MPASARAPSRSWLAAMGRRILMAFALLAGPLTLAWPADPPPTAGLSAGLDAVQRRAMWEGWVLRYKEQYVSRNPLQEEEIKALVALAEKSRKPGQTEVAVDSDEDGIPNGWIYFAEDKPAWYETDRLGTGTHDLRVNLRSDKWQASEIVGWFRDPPVPLGPAIPIPVQFPDLFAAAISAAKGLSPAPIETHVQETFPRLKEDIEGLARRGPDPAMSRRLTEVLDRVRPLVERFQREFSEEPELAKKLKTPRGFRVDYRPHDLDGKPGKEVAVGFNPKGVARVQFFRKDWLEPDGPVADCWIEGGEPVRLDLEGKHYLRLHGHWLRFTASARGIIARRCLGPAFAAFQAGRWYEAVARWQQGSRLAAIVGDLELGSRGQVLDTELSERLRPQWDFRVDDHPAFALLQVAVGLGASRGLEGLSELADDALERRRLDDAMALYRLYSRFGRKLDQPVDEVYALDQIAMIHKLVGRYDQALACLLQSLDLEATVSYSVNLAHNLEMLADADDPVAFRRAVALRSHAMAVNRACKLAGIAALSAELGEQVSAEGYLAEAERLFRSLGHKHGEADALNLRAQWDLINGQPDLALQRLERALTISQEQLAAQKALQEKSVAAGRQDKAAIQGNQALHTFRVPESGGYMIVGMAAPSHPLCFQALTASLRGEAYLQKASALAADRPAEANALLEEAARWQRQALDWYRAGEDPAGQVVSRFRLAMLAYQRRNLPDALQLAAEVEKHARTAGLPEVLWRAHGLHGAVAAAQGRTEDAIRQYELAAAEIESLRTALQSEGARQGFFGSRLIAYEQLALLQQARGESAKVWDCMERARARTLLELVVGQNLPVKGREVAQLSNEQPLLLQQLRSGAGPQARSTSDAGKSYLDYLAQLRDRPLLQELTSLGTVNPAPLKDLQSVLEPNTLVVAYFLAGDDLLAALVSRERLAVLKLPGLSRTQLQKDVDEFRRLLQDPRSQYEATAHKLYRELLGPCLEGQTQVEHLCIIPSGALHYLPFHALLAHEDRFVIQNHRVSYAASGSALYYAHHRHKDRQAKAGGRTVVVAEPAPALNLGQLPYATIEGARVHQLAPEPRVLLRGKEATEAAVLAELPSARCFHFAGHTHLLPNMPLQTALLCTPDVDHDGRLEVGELFGLNLRQCDLAILSACETHLGRHGRGDEIVGLTRAFLRAGVPTVVASLWRVPDESTFRLMARFHELRQTAGKSPLDALTQAQREFIADRLQLVRLTPGEKTAVTRRQSELALARGLILEPAAIPEPPMSRPHPFYWAAFELLGEWR